jgi:hypothetical protein
MATQIGVGRWQSINISGGAAVQTAEVIVGPSATNEMTVTATNIWTWDGVPTQGSATEVINVWLQPRQASDNNQDNNWADQFAVQFLMWQNTGPGNLQITFKVTRLDILFNHPIPVPQIGWGQNLQVDIMLLTRQGPVV